MECQLSILKIENKELFRKYLFMIFDTNIALIFSFYQISMKKINQINNIYILFMFVIITIYIISFNINR